MKVRDRLARRGDDGGFTLIEVMVASLLFIVLATSATLALGQLMKASGTAEARVVATSLATRQIETARSIAATAITDSTYTVTLVVQLHRRPDRGARHRRRYRQRLRGRLRCGLLRQRVTVNVTWPGMGSTPPVRTDTVRALPISGAVGGLGTLTFAVRDRNGVPVKDQPVILRKGATIDRHDDDPRRRLRGVRWAHPRYRLQRQPVELRLRGQQARRDLGPCASERPGELYVTKDPGWSWDRSMGMQVSVTAPERVPDAGLWWHSAW